jgi:small subunit ribosomal protein S18
MNRRREEAAADYVRQLRKKHCQFCKDAVEYIDYKDAGMLRKFMTDRGKIKPRRVTGTCTQHQHELAVSIKRAREMALVPYATPVISGRIDRKSRG